MLKGGVIMDVIDAEQAKIAEAAGACAVMALERVPSDIRKEGGVARMSDPKMIKEIMAAVSIPVMAKARIGHIVECVKSRQVCSGEWLIWMCCAGHKSYKPLAPTTSTSQRSSRQQTPPITSTSTPLTFLSSAAARILARHYAVSLREQL